MTQPEGGIATQYSGLDSQYERYSSSPIRDFKPEDLQPDPTGKYGVIFVHPRVENSSGFPDKNVGLGGYLEQRYYLPKDVQGAHIRGRSVTGDLRVRMDPLVAQLGVDDDVYVLENAFGVVALQTKGKVRKRKVAEHASLQPGTLFSIKPLLGPVENSEQTPTQGLDTTP